MGRKRKIITGWRLFFLAVAAVIAFRVYDTRFINSAPLRGFYPDDSNLIVSSWDFPSAWNAIERGDVFKRMKEDWPRPYAPLELAARLKTGIRPSPTRVRMWAGNRVVFATAPEGDGITVYPGHLLRWADALRQALGSTPDADGVLQYRNCFYTWRNGYLVASMSRAYVVAAQGGDEMPRLVSDDSALFTMQWTGTHHGFVHVRSGDGLPISGELEFSATDGNQPLTLPQAWPGHPIASITARDSDDVANLWTIASGGLDTVKLFVSAYDLVSKSASAWSIQSPRDAWDSGADHISLALLGVDLRGGVPLPDVGLALRYSEKAPDLSPLDGVFDRQYAIPYEWNACPGTMFPLLGIDFSPCVARAQRDWIATTRESSMAELAGKLSDGPACAEGVDIALRLSWTEFGKAAEGLAHWLGENELLAHRDETDANASLVPKLKALSQLGELRIDGDVHGSVVKFKGQLAKPVKAVAQ